MTAFGIVTIILITASVCIMKFVYNGFITAKECVRQKPITAYYSEVKRRDNYCPLNEVSDNIKIVIVCAEDVRFYKHHGYRPESMVVALFKNASSGKVKMGGSTITQQLAKNMYFSFEKKLKRKMAELFVSVRLEKALTKDEILDFYLNIIYYGMDNYNIKDACRYYFDKAPNDVSLNEAVTLGSLLPAPTNYNPCNTNGYFKSAKKITLGKLVRRKILTEEQAAELMKLEYNEALNMDINVPHIVKRIRA